MDAQEWVVANSESPKLDLNSETLLHLLKNVNLIPVLIVIRKVEKTQIKVELF